jgi:hypothetical protein
MAVEACQTCHGQGQVYREYKPGKWRYEKCPAGCRDGKVNRRLI